MGSLLERLEARELTMVDVVNATPEPDGTPPTYCGSRRADHAHRPAGCGVELRHGRRGLPPIGADLTLDQAMKLVANLPPAIGRIRPLELVATALPVRRWTVGGSDSGNPHTTRVKAFPQARSAERAIVRRQGLEPRTR
jgi:hypothetical protein